LKEFGIEYGVAKEEAATKNPILTISRNENGYFFSGYVPNTTVGQRFKMTAGAPLLNGFQTKLVNGYSTYMLPTAWHREVRVFVDQQEGIVSCKEGHSGQKGISRRLHVSGLKNATVRIYAPENISAETLEVFLNAGYPYRNGQVKVKAGDAALGKHFVVEGATGEMTIAW
jgi:hypothetical protein